MEKPGSLGTWHSAVCWFGAPGHWQAWCGWVGARSHLVGVHEGSGECPCVEGAFRDAVLGTVDVQEDLAKRALDLLEQAHLCAFGDVRKDEVGDGGERGKIPARVG